VSSPPPPEDTQGLAPRRWPRALALDEPRRARRLATGLEDGSVRVGDHFTTADGTAAGTTTAAAGTTTAGARATTDGNGRLAPQ
jgi:hypothetical protein